MIKPNRQLLAAEFIRNFLQGKAIPGIEAEYVFHKEILNGITLDEVNRYAKRILTTDVPELVILSGSDKPDHPLPDAASLKAMVKQAKRLKSHNAKKGFVRGFISCATKSRKGNEQHDGCCFGNHHTDTEQRR